MEMVHLQKLYAKYASRGLSVVCILTNDVAETKGCATQLKLTYTMLADPDAKVTGSIFGVRAHPSELIIDKKGVVQFTQSGPADDKDLESRVQALLK
jgi:peroxiredoxin